MSSEISLPWALSMALLSVRLTMAWALSPAFASYGVPAMVRIVLILALAALTCVHLPPAESAVLAAAQPAKLIPAVFAEILIGALLGLGVHIVFGAVSLAGKLMDLQVGFGLGSVFDPVTRSVSNVLASLTTLLGVTLFVISDAPLQLAQLIIGSLGVLPLGQFPAFDDPMQSLLATGELFALGVALAAPVVVALMLTDVAIAVASRNMPKVNVLVLALPIKVIVGYLMLIFSLASWPVLLQPAFDRLARIPGAG